MNAAIQSVDSGPYLYAGPDCPEVNFLAERKSPLPVFMDFQGPQYGDTAAFLRLLEVRGVRTVVLNTTPTFSRRIPEDLSAELARRFPNSRRIGRFEVRWAGGAAAPSL